MHRLTLLLVLAALTAESAFCDTILIPAGARWQYLDDGIDQGTAWVDVDFDDTAWFNAPAQFGYGDGDETTVVSFGPDPDHKYPTTYFRRVFTVDDPAAHEVIQLGLLRDDGAVVHLNGTEIVRDNLPPGPVVWETLATEGVGGDDEDFFFRHLLDPSLFLTGQNLLAVEVHQASATSSDLGFDLELAGLTEWPDPFAKAPHLIYRGEPTAMKVVWQLKWATPATIEWGETSGIVHGRFETAETVETDERHLHDYNLSDLSPATTYTYRVIAQGDTLGGSFTTAPTSDATALKFMVYGDTRTYPAVHDTVAAAMIATYKRDPDYHSLVVMVGDLVSNGDSETDWQTEFFAPELKSVRTLFAHLPVQSCMGNHEESGVLFGTYFPYPFVDARYWSFDYGPAHFAIVDQYAVEEGLGPTQVAWLDADLAATDRPWKFVVLHEPGWSAGGHDPNVDVHNMIWPLCMVHDVAMVFAGHNHYYARAEVNGIQHITTGGGGAPLRQIDPAAPHVVTAASVHHFCKVEIAGDQLFFDAVAPDGTIIDSFRRSTPTTVGPLADEGVAPRPGLDPAFPNPFNAATTITFSLPETRTARLTVHDPAGRHVRTLVDGTLPTGIHRIAWDGRSDDGRLTGSGVYLYTLVSGDIELTGRVVMIK
jgi:hypothetical protein